MLDRDCPFQKEEGFGANVCKGYCEQYTWDRKSLPDKPEYFSKTRLRMIIQQVPLTEDYVDQIVAEMFGYLDGILELQEESGNPPLTRSLHDLVKKMENMDFSDYQATYFFYADFRKEVREYIDKIEAVKRIKELNVEG